MQKCLPICVNWEVKGWSKLKPLEKVLVLLSIVATYGDTIKFESE